METAGIIVASVLGLLGVAVVFATFLLPPPCPNCHRRDCQIFILGDGQAAWRCFKCGQLFH